MKEKKYIVIPQIKGIDGDASIIIYNATFQIEDNLSKKYPDPDFGTWLIDEIYNKKKIFAERKGFINKKLFCPSCDSELIKDVKTPQQIEWELKYKELMPFVIQIKIPAIECPICNRICGIDPNGSLSFHLNEAIIKALKSADITP